MEFCSIDYRNQVIGIMGTACEKGSWVGEFRFIHLFTGR